MVPSDVGWTIHGADIKATVLRLSRSDAHKTKETWRRREVKNHVFRYNSTSWQPFSHPIFAFGCLSDSGYYDIYTISGMGGNYLGNSYFQL